MDHEFFERAALAICGDLRPEVALRDCVNAIRERIPVARMLLQVFEPSVGAIRVIASATATDAVKMDVLTPLPRDLVERLATISAADAKGTVFRDTPENNPATERMLRAHGAEGSSILRLNLLTDNGRFGNVILLADGRDRYDEEHAALLAPLEGLFGVALHNALQHRELIELRDRLADDNRYLHHELQRLVGDEIIGSDFGLGPVMRLVGQVAPTDSPVLLTGETGVGKDIIASAIHRASARRDGPFIAVNCGAIPDSLLDSELFGHEKGAFTGALAQKRGRFERAHQGTIFLDEIGDMPLQAQVRLLRVLQNREIERIGGTRRIPVDIRIIAATNHDLEELIRAGRFREDLWFRINVFPIEIPALRDRTGDIPALVQHFVERKARRLRLPSTPELAPGALDLLLGYRWPGNVRELENLVERALIISGGEPLQFELDRANRPSPRTGAGTGTRTGAQTPPSSSGGDLATLHEMEAQHIKRALAMTDGKIHGVGGAGELLGINPNTLRHRMRKHGIPFKQKGA